MGTHKIHANLDVDGEVQGTSLDINGAAAINGKVVIEGDSAAWNVTTPGLTTGSLHFDPGASTNDFGNAITFGASDAGSGANAHAGIYLRTDGGYGTRMYFATTDSYATGSKVAFYINNNKKVYFNDDITVAGDVEGASLDINGNADISGNITSANWTGDVIGSAYLDSDTMHLSVSQNITAHKEFQDSIQLRFGNDQDLRIQHTGSHGYLDCETGSLHIRAEANDSHIYIQADNGSGANATYIDVDGDNELILLSKPLKIGTGATVSTILDEDAMGSNSATALATQQSIKAYVTASVSAAGGGDVTLSGTQTFTGAKTFTGTVALTGTGRITGIDTVSASTDAASKAYVDGAVIANTDTQDLSISGQTLSLTNGGSVTLPDTNTQLSLSNSVTSTSTTVAASSAAAKSAYDRGSTGVTNAASAQTTANAALPKAGGTMSGAIAMGNQNITGANNITAASLRCSNIVTNKVVKFDGTQLNDANITDTGSLITLGSNTVVSGELEATTLDINGAADISGALTVGGSVFTLTAPDAGSAPAMTATLNMRGYEGRGIGIKMRPHVTSAANATNAEWFMGSGYSNSGFNIGYAADGSQSSYAAQSKLIIATNGDATFAGDVTISGGDLLLSGTGRIQGIDTVTASTDAASKAYVDGAVIANTDTQDLSISGQTLSLTNGGSVTIPTQTSVSGSAGTVSSIGNLTGDVTSSNRATTIASAAVHHAMLHDDIISGQGALTSGLADTDEFMISDAGTVKRMDASVLKTYMQNGLTFTTNTNTQLSTEAVQDIVGAMLVGTETRIGVTYDDTNGRINFVVDDMTANTNTQLSNAEVRAAVAAATDSQVFTDADHTKLNGIATNATADQTNVSGSSGSCTGNAATATKISSITNSNIVQLSTTTTQTGTKTFSGVVDITNSTDSTNATGDTGALRTEGGASIAKKLYVGSTITGSADVIAFSDRKLKENIETLDGKKVLDMRGVSFTRKDTGAESSGVIAQEIQKVAPELVHDTEGTLGVAYGNLVGYLIEAVKDQQKQIDELKKLCNGCSR